jgi:hypothetical protein
MASSEIFDANVSEFLSAVSRQIEAYNPTFSYVASRTGEDFAIGQAAIHLNTGPIATPQPHFLSNDLKAGQYRLKELKLSLEETLTSLLSGHLETPSGILIFNPALDGKYHSSFEPLHPAGLQNQSRFAVLKLIGASQPLSIKRTVLDWELRAALPPYDNVQELLNDYQLGPLNTEFSSIEFVAFNVAVVEFASKALSFSRAKIWIRL